MNAPLASAVYEGWVRHRRHAPRAHAFRYRLAQLYLDLDEIETVFARRWLSRRIEQTHVPYRRAR